MDSSRRITWRRVGHLHGDGQGDHGGHGDHGDHGDHGGKNMPRKHGSEIAHCIEESSILENALRCENTNLTPSLPQQMTWAHIWPGCDGLEISQVVHTVDKDKL